MHNNDHNPEKDAAKIIFIVFAIAFAAYIILLKHANAHAQNGEEKSRSQESTQDSSLMNTPKIIEEIRKMVVRTTNNDDLDDLVDAEESEDPFFGIDGVEVQTFEEPSRENEFLPEPPNPYMKEGYREEDWKRHSDYQYFLWLEYEPMNDTEKELLEREKEQIQAQMRDMVLEHISFCVRKDGGKKITHKACVKAYGGCDRRIDALTTYIVTVAYDLHIDPWLLAGMSMHESTFNPFAVSTMGARGFLQINPKIPLAKKIKFINNARYRRKCKKEIGNCQLEIAKAAAIHLYKDFRKCKNRLPQALTAYNAGPCLMPNGKPRWEYVNSVMQFKRKLESGVTPVRWCEEK